MSKRIPCLATMLVCVSLTPALAGPFDPAFKGGPDSIHVAFDWDTFDAPWTVSEFSNGPTSYPLSDQGPSSIEADAEVAFIIPNLIDPLPVKHLRMQLFFDGAVDFNLIDVSVVGHDPLGALATETGRGGDHSLHVYYIDFDIVPNPDWEEIFFHGDPAGGIVPGNFNRLEVDTVSVPEPATLSLLCVGSVPLIRRRL